MFGKNLGQMLKQYLRRLWPFAIPVAVTGIITCIVALPNVYASKINFYMAAFSSFIIAVFTFVIRGVIHSYISFFKIDCSINAENTSNSAYLVQLSAFMIFIAVSALLTFLCVLLFAWDTVGQMFSAFATDWLYFLELMFYILIISFSVYLIPTTWIAVFRFNKQKKWPRVLSLIVGITILIICVFTMYFEAPLTALNHSTDTTELWLIIITLLSIITLGNIGMFLLSYFTLKTNFIDVNQ